MEAGNGLNGLNMDVRPGCKIVHWDNDWNKFKRLFKAVGWLNSITKALKYGEILAYKASKEVKNEMCDEQVEDLKLKAMGQSPKLVALLTLAIANSVGAQQSM